MKHTKNETDIVNSKVTNMDEVVTTTSSITHVHPFKRSFYFMCACLVVANWLLSSSVGDTNSMSNWTELLPASEKLDIIWDRITSNRQSREWTGVIELLVRGFLLQTDNTERITESSTIRKSDKTKFIHAQGAFARIRWKPRANSLGYTGMFSEDAEGLISFSKGNRFVAASNSFGVGIQLFRDNAPPAAVVMCGPTTGAGRFTNVEWNLLDVPLCNHIDFPSGMALLSMARKRPQVGLNTDLWTMWGNGFGLSNVAATTLSGEPVVDPHFPFSICLRAPLSLAKQYRDLGRWDHPRDIVSKYPTNEVLYEVLAIDRPSMLSDPNISSKVQVVAEISTTSEFVRSAFGDLKIQFQHQRFEEDFELRPEWKPEMTIANVMMDGWAYLDIYKDRIRFPTVDDVGDAVIPSTFFLFQVLTNPTVAWNFLYSDIGLDYAGATISQFAASVQGFSEDLLGLTDPGSGISGFGIEARDSNAVRQIAELISPADLDAVYKFATTVGSRIEFDGHFINPLDVSAAIAMVSQPAFREIAGLAIERYQETFGVSFITDILRTTGNVPVTLATLLESLLSSLSPSELSVVTSSEQFDSVSSSDNTVQMLKERRLRNTQGLFVEETVKCDRSRDKLRRMLESWRGPLERLASVTVS
eukprot:GHVQ01043526.1.p1 GENE.GHVQ01043526.1~~GHVQ01043526.1.p1  ORF type:complete len:644 (+),score=63.99 GHVQ01043526.1:365-2296(+)